MALQRKLLLAGLTVSSLLCVYILCVNLDGPLPWSIQPLKHLSEFTLHMSSNPEYTEEPPDTKSSTQQGTHPPSTSQPYRLMPTKVLKTTTEQTLKLVLTSTSGLHSTEDRTCTKGPTVAARLSEPDFIGDTYSSEDVAPQTDCSDSIRGRVGKTEFGGQFVGNIPVLQSAKHVTCEQYKRLTTWPGAHGWGGLDYQMLVETLSVLNSSANLHLLDDWKSRSNKSECRRCAVVGNGGILKNSLKGEEIDGHHYVFRTNGAIIKGFEKDVGSRTTHYTFSTNTLMNSMRSYAGVGYRGPPVSNETRYVFLPDHDRDYLLMKAAATHTPVERGAERGKDPLAYFGKDVTAEKLKMYHPDFVRYLRNRFLRSNTMKTKYKNIYRPSTGAVMLLAALHTCDQVSAYGFMTPDYKNYSDHYYDSSYRPVGFFINHDLRMEMTLWQQLHQAGLIRLYMRH